MHPSPWLLYAYPWMPFPRRVIIYLREKGIPASLITIVRVSDPPENKVLDDTVPARPAGSLPILAISDANGGEPTYIRQSLAIMNYIDELCDNAAHGFPHSSYSIRGADILSCARVTELMCLADECTVAWNPVRTFGSGAGTMAVPAASKEMLRWIRRTLGTIERWFENEDFSSLAHGGARGPNMAEIVLFQFFEFTRDCYGVDMTQGSGDKVTDVYGRQVIEQFPKLVEFYEAFRTRPSVKRDALAGEVAPEGTLKRMTTWAEGAL